jgi:hypothetical protein
MERVLPEWRNWSMLTRDVLFCDSLLDCIIHQSAKPWSLVMENMCSASIKELNQKIHKIANASGRHDNDSIDGEPDNMKWRFLSSRSYYQIKENGFIH